MKFMKANARLLQLHIRRVDRVIGAVTWNRSAPRMWPSMIFMDPLELEPSSGIETANDSRPRMDEPPPVRLVAVDDVRLPTPPDLDVELDAFYVGLWQFQRDTTQPGLTYRAENFRLRFETNSSEPIERETLRPQGILVLSLAGAQQKLIDLEWEYTQQLSLTPGQESLLLQDPAGNWIELFESRRIG
jgi:hypothetical protein